MSSNPYQILHLDQDASYEEIKERYRHLTKNLHPDKQPLQNYQITKKLFEEIDGAYKSISSPLRRLLYRQYGANALKILQEAPQMFEEYDIDELSEDKKKALKQLMIFLLYEKQACFELDKTKFMTKMVVNITKTLKGRPKFFRRMSKRNFYIPELQNCSFQYEMVLPQLLGFSNSFSVGLTTNDIRSIPKSTTNFALTSTKRLEKNYMLSISSNISNKDTNVDIGIDKICENHLVLKFIPVSINNGTLSNPKFGLQKSFNGFMFSAMTDLNSINFNFNESHQNKFTRSLGIFMENNAIGLNPKIEYEVNSYLSLFSQISTSFQFVSAEKNINLKPSIIYGYKLKIVEDLKIEFASCIGSSNYFHISFVSNKFRVMIPLITSQSELIKFELFKVVSMLSVYLIFETMKENRRTNQKQKEKLLKQNDTRLKDVKRELNRDLSYIEIISKDKKQKQIKYNGLIIISSFLGQLHKINHVDSQIKKLTFKKDIPLEDAINQIEADILALNLNVGEPKDQIQEITAIIQSQVIGGQIINYNLDQLQKYSPTLNPNEKSNIFIAYLDRGILRTFKGPCENNLNLGTLEISKITSGFKKMLNYMIKYII